MVEVEIRLADFAITVAVDAERAPISSRYFLQDVDTGLLDGSSLFRIVTSSIEVVQMGLCERDPGIAPTIEHETTRKTGLRHLQGNFAGRTCKMVGIEFCPYPDSAVADVQVLR